MGRRSEQRTAISFPVIVRGLDARGTPFILAAKTRDISVSGVRVHGIEHVATPGKRVEIDYKNERAWYRIQWIGESGTAKAGDVGLRGLEPGKYLWGIQPKEWAPDTYDPSISDIATQGFAQPNSAGNGVGSWGGKNRRRFARRLCRIETYVTAQDSSVRVAGTVTDISLSGCYVEMLAPFPLNTAVELDVNCGDAMLYLSGIVRSSQGGLGMGIHFEGMNSDDYEKLRSFAPPTAEVSKHDASRSMPATPRSRANPLLIGNHQSSLPESNPDQSAAMAEALEAIVRILSRKGFLTPSEISQEIEKLKTAKV